MSPTKQLHCAQFIHVSLKKFQLGYYFFTLTPLESKTFFLYDTKISVTSNESGEEIKPLATNGGLKNSV